MSYNIDFSLAASKQIETALCHRLEKIRLSRNITQPQLATKSGVSTRTIRRLENGEGISLNTFIRILMALGLQNNLQEILPDPAIQPINLIKNKNNDRKRARPQHSDKQNKQWTWGDEKSEDEH